MATTDNFLNLQEHLELLKINIEKLQKSLRHWQTWEAEYEGLKEEILTAPSPDRTQLVELSRGYEADLVTQKEIVDILGTSSRTASQVVAILNHRIDYVEQNVKTIQKQLDAAERKLEAAVEIFRTPDVEGGLPLTDITEELDEDGNVISSHTTTPGSAAPQLMEVLKQAGVTDTSALKNSLKSSENPTENTPPPSQPAPKPTKKGVTFAEDTKPEEPLKEKTLPSRPAPKSTKKGVRFTNDTKPGPTPEILPSAKRAGSTPQHSQTPEISQNAIRMEEIMRKAKEADESLSGNPIIPTDESAEDAALRREMIYHAFNDVGPIVAQLELEEGSDWTDEDEDDEDDEEDQFGRSIRKVPYSYPVPIAPSGPEGAILANTIVERTTNPDEEVAEPDEWDPQIMHQQVAMEYNRMRNKMIQKQGGFMKEDESEIVPLAEEEGGPKKISRFKAARLAKS